MAPLTAAARGVFEVSCKNLSWAVVDSGIDARHPAFRLRKWDEKQGKDVLLPQPFETDGKNRVKNQTRVIATYDFVRIREILKTIRKTPQADLPTVPPPAPGPPQGGDAPQPPAPLPAEPPEPPAPAAPQAPDAAPAPEAAAQPDRMQTNPLPARPPDAPRAAPSERDGMSKPPDDARALDMSDENVQALRAALRRGGNIDWNLLGPLLEVKPGDGYKSPRNEHGTHVAGILAGDWRKDELTTDDEEDLRGVCPDLRLYDLRVLDDNGRGDEFTVMAALQFIRHLNAHQDHIAIHGVNLSLSIHHDVANYACGCTPVCEECERLVNAGTVVVAAAGNKGYLHYMTPEGKESEAYGSISITDPGNAEGVITVGSTHAFRPHTYGVSYFSSRGPTGDGRLKPDLVAPGEKINSPVPGASAKRKDGTSMAAPHVSGAAALLIARHQELVGRPKRVKEILCETATDLGREKYFQGRGMVDVLRALQSV